MPLIFDPGTADLSTAQASTAQASTAEPVEAEPHLTLTHALSSAVLEPHILARLAPTVRKRPKPGERRLQILRTLARMLEVPGAERVTTAALAARLEVSEAALYRHFASKAQMFEGLIEFIEGSVFTLIEQIQERQAVPRARAGEILTVLLQFAQSNPGLARVMVGDALVFENDRLLARMNQFFERFESQLRQSLGADEANPVPRTPGVGVDVDASAQAAVMTAFAVGTLQRFARSGFKCRPVEHLGAALRLLAG